MAERKERAMTFEIGIMTFGEVTDDPRTGTMPSQRVLDTIEQAKVADTGLTSRGR